MNELSARVARAVAQFWEVRGAQSTRQGESEARDRGARAAVTGGRQMEGFVRLVHDLLTEAGTPADRIHRDKGLELPGWFRAEKKWDLLVIHQGNLLAAVEFKSHVGPSFGNNFNNRTEEAIGSATDLWAAYREGAFKPSSRPWLGYFMLLEDCERSRAPVVCKSPHYPPFGEFAGASYQRRYEILIEKLLRDRLYDGACFLLTHSLHGENGQYAEPAEELTFERFILPLIGHVTSMCR